MTLSMTLCHASVRNVLDIPSGNRLKFDRADTAPKWQKERLVFVMGATGTGKSRLAIDLATKFPAEIINSDKMQIYEGLDIVTNKVTEEEKRGVRHHLLGSVANVEADVPSSEFCSMASLAIESISGRGSLPIIVGGSNSYIESLVDGDDDHNSRSFKSRYDCCFLWMDVAKHVHDKVLAKRVDIMVERGLADEVRNMFDPLADYSRGLRKSIGVPELHKYFLYLLEASSVDDETRARLLRDAIRDIKDNTCDLASRQAEKIRRLRNVKGWNIHRLDATEIYCKSGKEAEEAWQRLVAGPSTDIVTKFLCYK